jgi:DCN1-like protein 4/5
LIRLSCKTIKELKKLLPKMEKELQDPRVFKKMYKGIFDTFLIKSLTMDFAFAEQLWSVLLAKEFTYLREFQQYLDFLGAKKPTKCHKDLWNMMYEFASVVKDINKDYSETDAWPVFIDNFVDWLKE